MTGIWQSTYFMSRVEQELAILEQLNLPPVFNCGLRRPIRVAQSLFSWWCFVKHCLSFCSLSFGHFNFAVFWFTTSDYVFDIFKLIMWLIICSKTKHGNLIRMKRYCRINTWYKHETITINKNHKHKKTTNKSKLVLLWAQLAKIYTPAPHICPTYFHNQNITDCSNQK